eukprot:TRINITY_DN5820_c0_g1_i1.p1 TRINITY_DN5820_c0_g1~~TRINITY_DN5820_c0_g1_i1.p1  ORF type:complete len:666 (-),score=148.84 TRINITY_DN5820_c0_g1_i1:185-2182(-)
MSTFALICAFVPLVSFVFWLRHRKYQTIDIRKEKDGETPVKRAAHHPALVKDLPGISTLHESFNVAVTRYPHRKCTGTKIRLDGTTPDAYEWSDYTKIQLRSRNFGSGLVHLNLKRGDKLGVFSKNREEWIIAQQGAFRQSIIIVSYYETLGRETIQYVTDHSGVRIVVCSKENLKRLFEINGIHDIIVLDEITKDDHLAAKIKGINLHEFSEIEKLGSSEVVAEDPPHGDDLATLMYTSGTTGMPKGVMITHGNIVACLAAIEKIAELFDGDVYISYLPFAHILERMLVCAVFANGGAVGFFGGDPKKLSSDMKSMQPTLFAAVPRVLDRIRDGILDKVSKQGLIPKTIFRLAFSIKRRAILSRVPLFFIGSLLDKIVFSKVKLETGGNIRLCVVGGAPLSLESELFLRVCLSCNVLQGYGLTETCGASFVKLLDDQAVGILGPPLPCIEFKLVDVPEMNYLSTDKPARGEIYIRGASVALGYYKDEEKTKEDFLEGGWFRTGDIGRINGDGTLCIIDRKKNIFKLSQGEYIAVEKIEGVLKQKNDLVNQIWIYGNSERSFVIAFVVPKQEKLIPFLKSKGIRVDSIDDADKNPKAREAVCQSLNETGKAEGLYGFELPRGVQLVEEEFTEHNDLLTPTLKLKRPQLKQHFQKQIEQLYREIKD